MCKCSEPVLPRPVEGKLVFGVNGSDHTASQEFCEEALVPAIKLMLDDVSEAAKVSKANNAWGHSMPTSCDVASLALCNLSGAGSFNFRLQLHLQFVLNS